MKSKMSYALVAAYTVRLKKLLARKTVLRFFRLSDDGISAFLERSRIVTETDCVRKFSKSLFQIFNVSKIIKVNDVAVFCGIFVFLRRSFVGSKNNIFSLNAGIHAQHKFRKA